MELEIIQAFKQAAREMAEEELIARPLNYHLKSLSVREIDEQAIKRYESWRTPFDFGWERVLVWKCRLAHRKAIDIAVWYDEILAGMCWASPKHSNEKIFVLYLERNPDNDLPTRGHIAPLCLSAVRNYAMLLGLTYVVIENPTPGARSAYYREGFVNLPGIGLVYDLTQNYDFRNNEASENDH